MINQLINSYKEQEATFSKGLSNHLPMALSALNLIGAKEDEIKDFAHVYLETRDIKTIHDAKQNEINDLKPYIGKQKYYPELKVYFKNKIQSHGYEAVLSDYLDSLMPGSSGDAFHGLIRLAYGVESQNEEEIAAGLAYLADAYYDFNIDPLSLGLREPLEQVKELNKMYYKSNLSVENGLIIKKMTLLSEKQVVKDALRNLPEGSFNIERLLDLSATLFAYSMDFTLLHGFTSTQALLVLNPFIQNQNLAYAYHWLHLQLAYLSTQAPKLDETMTVETNFSWHDIFKKGIQSKDAHVIKVHHSLYAAKAFMSLSEDFIKGIALQYANKMDRED